jgi:signal transduction histidine kinase
MRSLFAKILGWFILALVLTVAALVVTSALSYSPNSPVRAPFSLLLGLGLRDARYAWETGGRDGLNGSLTRFHDATRIPSTIFTDAAGTDLLTGEAHADLMGKARAWSRFPLVTRDGLVFARFSADGKYCLLITTTPVRLLLSNLQVAHLLVLVIIVLLCYALAYHLTAPLRGLSKALERFGQGDLGARAEDHRHDELGDLARSYNRMAERIQTLLAAERRLLLDISHELRSPLTRLSVAVELARGGRATALPLDRIQKEADRLNDLISQMLQVTRLEGDPSNRVTTPVRLDELVRELVNDCSIEASAGDCSLVFPNPPELTVPGNAELLRRAIENVMRNAIRHAPSESKVEVRVETVGVETGGGQARVSIRDYGPGVPEEALPRIFDAFFRVDSDRNRRSGGAGLGLSIARRAVELHKGKLRASNAGPGLLVEIELPV